MLGALDMFAVGIGPSSSHTIGPMKAALAFNQLLVEQNLLTKVVKIKVNLYGSLALTGHGHGTVVATLNGLAGNNPKTVDPDVFIKLQELTKHTKKLNLNNQHIIDFDFAHDIELHKTEFLPQHANGMRFIAYDNKDNQLLQEEYFSVGGGFILDHTQMQNLLDGKEIKEAEINIPYPFSSAQELMHLCSENNLTIAQLVFENELVRKSKDQVRTEALEIINTMHQSIERGLVMEGTLPGGLNVRRRAPGLYKRIMQENKGVVSKDDQRLLAMVYAMSVNEENAAFSRIVTAPTNGAAGTIPAVMEYYRNFCEGDDEDKLIEFILTAGAIGMLYKMGASISAAEVGCQGEIGVACSMACGALTAVLGGNLMQITKAAEIGMEHNLGMTCDPIGGLVQIPCIERNGVAATKAIDIAKLALLEDKPGLVSLDQIIKTMLQTGRDMSMHYKETSLGGLAVNVANC